MVIFKKLGEFDDELTYKVPEDFIAQCNVGTFVEVPFRSRVQQAVITSVSEKCDLSDEKIRSISSALAEPKLASRQIELARFISSYYRTSMARALRLFLPKLLWNGKLNPPAIKVYRITDPKSVLRGDRQKQIFDHICQNGGGSSFDDLKKSIDKFSTASLNSLIKKDVIGEKTEIVFKPFDPKKDILKKPDKVLTSDQTSVIQQIQKADKPILLHGVTGSGKTEIYLRRILDTIQSGKQAILLVPEIALTPQMINYFQDFLGDHIALFHSKLGDSGRAREWWKVKSGYSPLVIGSRSAIFAPVDDPGLIILDEEHEWTYKQESAPYYQTHRVAYEMATKWKTELIFGSATPSAESYQKAEEGEYIYARLPERIHRSDLPPIEIVDLRDEFKKRNFSIFSLLLQNKIKEKLGKKEQIILFVNQRGLANAVVCRDCGYTENCPYCDISLKFHRNFQSQVRVSSASGDRLVCHYCNYTKKPELLCPECRSPHIKHVGVGTQRVEEEACRLFPEARVIRADSDTTKSSDGFRSIYHDFLEHKYDILIGTQMIAKGLDFSKVSLIGIVLADIGLHRPDFRSSERLFQILTQVSGRCGRRENLGEVVLQTYNPDHPTIKKVSSYAYDDFIKKELKERSE
ncbi:primosomal protein N', partial [candidate division KSB1 bacterium]